MSKKRSRSRNPRVAVSKDGLVFWTAEEDDALRHALKITPFRQGRHDWNAMERVCRDAGVQRSARMLRNRHLRMTRRKDPAGKKVYLCLACGLPRAGHTCRAVLTAQPNGGYPSVVLRCKIPPMSPIPSPSPIPSGASPSPIPSPSSLSPLSLLSPTDLAEVAAFAELPKQTLLTLPRPATPPSAFDPLAPTDADRDAWEPAGFFAPNCPLLHALQLEM